MPHAPRPVTPPHEGQDPPRGEAYRRLWRLLLSPSATTEPPARWLAATCKNRREGGRDGRCA